MSLTNPDPRTVERVLELYSPYRMQLAMHNSLARYRIGAFGRQSGKSTWGGQELLKHAWRNPGRTYWYILPIAAQARILYRRLLGSVFGCRQILLKKNQTEFRIKLLNSSQIFFKSGDNPDSLRTETLHGVIIDEVREQHPDLWKMVIQPMLRTTKGWAAFVSTPNGFDHFYDLHERALSDKRGTWESFQAPSTCNPLFTMEEFEDARHEMTEAQFAQEILAEFRDITRGRAYLNYDSRLHEMKDCPWAPGDRKSPYLPIVVDCDFNLNPMSWTLCQTRGGDWYAFDQIHLEASHTQEAAGVLVDKVKGHGQGVIITGDATSKAGQRAAAGKSDYDIIFTMLREAGIRYIDRVPKSNPFIKDRVNSFNAKLKAADGTIHFWHHKDCRALKKDLQRVVWKDIEGFVLSPGKDKSLTHASDGVGYGICELTPIKQIGNVGGLRVIRR
jgi:hypothetical protein